jgi:hypothetical protein
MITIERDGQEILITDFFDREMAKLECKYLSWSEGVARLFIPDSIKLEAIKMMKMEYVCLSRITLGKSEALELHFDNHLLMPFKILLFKESYENFLTEVDDTTYFFDFCVWTSDGLQVTLRGMFSGLNNEKITGTALALLTIPSIIHTPKRAGEPLFSLGEIQVTKVALPILLEEGIDYTEFLQRHIRGDWGSVCNGFLDQNNDAISAQYGVIISSYEIRKSDMVIDSECAYHKYLEHPGMLWVMTELYGSVATTTLYSPSECYLSETVVGKS